MRFNKKPPHKIGSKKTVIKFAWLPRALDGEMNSEGNIVWLERYKVHYEFKELTMTIPYPPFMTYKQGQWVECYPWEQFYRDQKLIDAKYKRENLGGYQPTEDTLDASNPPKGNLSPFSREECIFCYCHHDPLCRKDKCLCPNNKHKPQNGTIENQNQQS